MLEAMAADVWYSQEVFVPVGYLLAGLVLALFVPANQVLALLLEYLPGDYEVSVRRKD